MHRLFSIGIVVCGLALAGCSQQNGKCSTCGADCKKADCCKEDKPAGDSKGAQQPAAQSAVAERKVYAVFGEPMKTTESETITLATLVAAPENYNGKTVRVAGKVGDVCKQKGCWLSMADAAGKPVFVKFTCEIIQERLVPVDAVGHECIVEGKLTIEEVTEDQARHMAEEAGKSDAEIMAIKGTQKRLRIASPAALVYGIPQPTTR